MGKRSSTGRLPVVPNDDCITSSSLFLLGFLFFLQGVVIDHEETTQKLKVEYWDPMWAQSFKGDDCDVQEVMDGLDIDRTGESANAALDSTDAAKLRKQGLQQQAHVAGNADFYDADNEDL